jgi:hypothetical protein
MDTRRRACTITSRQRRSADRTDRSPVVGKPSLIGLRKVVRDTSVILVKGRRLEERTMEICALLILQSEGNQRVTQ